MSRDEDRVTRVKAKEQRELLDTPKSVKIVIAVVVGLLFLFILIGMLSGGDSDNNTDNKTASGTSQLQDKANADSEPSSGEKVSLDESEAEKYCQDDNLTPILSGNAEYSDVNMIDVWNYNKNYMEYGKDKDGYPVMILTWNGKSGDKTLSFSCYVSGPKDDPTLHYLSMSGETMRGDPELSDVR